MSVAIFDMDGVIVDSEPIHFKTDLLVLEMCGAKVEKEYLEQFVGYTNPEMWKIIKKDLGLKERVEDLIKMQLDIKLRIVKEEDLEAIEGIINLLMKLQDNDYRIALASSSPRIFIEAILDKLNIGKFFEYYVSGEEVDNGKPAPDIFLDVIEKMNVHPHDCFVIEDSKSGVAAAKAAGLFCYGFLNPNSGEQDLTGADYVSDSIYQFFDRV